jgi:hypothetical protein
MDGSSCANGSGAFTGPLACPAFHISPSECYAAALSAPESARAVELIPFEKDQRRRNPPPKRRAITTFSRASRRRLLWLIGELHEAILQKALFLTLTYPKDDPTAALHQKHLDSLLKRLKRHAPESSAIWKLEYTKANTPHYHLLILNLEFWHHKRIAKAWSEIVQSDNPNHERAGTRVERVMCHKHVAKYIVKYVSKASPLPPNHRGRLWGKSGAIGKALAQKTIFLITKKTYLQIRRIFDRVRKASNRQRPFKRASCTAHRQRWFMRGSSAISLLAHLGISPIPP